MEKGTAVPSWIINLFRFQWHSESTYFH